jgi:hypothetical protein
MMGKRVRGGGGERAGDHNAERDLVSATGSPAEHGWTRGKAAPEGLPPARQTFEAPRRKRSLQGDSFTREHDTDHGKRPVTRRQAREGAECGPGRLGRRRSVNLEENGLSIGLESMGTAENTSESRRARARTASES